DLRSQPDQALLQRPARPPRDLQAFADLQVHRTAADDESANRSLVQTRARRSGAGILARGEEKPGEEDGGADRRADAGPQGQRPRHAPKPLARRPGPGRPRRDDRRTGRRSPAGGRDLFEDEGGRADRQPLAGNPYHSLRERISLEEAAVSRAEVLDGHRLPRDLHAQVLARGGWIVEDDVGGGRAPDDEAPLAQVDEALRIRRGDPQSESSHRLTPEAALGRSARKAPRRRQGR